jgi:hypothetical protein
MGGQGIRRKALQRKINNGNTFIKSSRQMRTQEDNPKIKTKVNNQQKLGKDPMQKRLMAMK